LACNRPPGCDGHWARVFALPDEHELVPDQHLLVIRALSVGKAPSQKLVVRSARQHTIAQRGILDNQESAAPAIEAGTEVRVKVSA
jgi:hypothetical protein